jgi:signal transduction histidine kinase
MHDGLAQSLFSASLALEVCKRRLRGEPDVAERLAETQQLLAESLSELRRYIYDLQPARLDTLGLAGAMRAKVAEINSVEAVDVTLDILGPQRELSQSAEACLYRVTQEALSNAARHSGAAVVRALLQYRNDGVELSIADDGDGFDFEAALARSEAGHSMGLRSMRERVAELGGHVEIMSAPGLGTSIDLELPL